MLVSFDVSLLAAVREDKEGEGMGDILLFVVDVDEELRDNNEGSDDAELDLLLSALGANFVVEVPDFDFSI